MGKGGVSGRVGEWESGRAGERESGRVGEWESGRVGERESGEPARYNLGTSLTHFHRQNGHLEVHRMPWLERSTVFLGCTRFPAPRHSRSPALPTEK